MINVTTLSDLQKIYDEEQNLKRKLQESLSSLDTLRKQFDLIVKEKNEASHKLHQLKIKLGDENFKLQTEESNWKKLNNELYTTHQSNPRYLKELENKIKDLGKIKDTEEETILYLMDDLDQLSKKLELVLQQENEIQEAYTIKKSSHEGLEAQIKEDLFSLSMQKKSIRENLDEEMLNIFDKMMMQCQGKAVALLNQGECSICRFQVPLSHTEIIKKQREQLHYCPNCKRILLIK